MLEQVLPLVSQQLLLAAMGFPLMAMVTKPLVPYDRRIMLKKMCMWKECHLTAKEQYLHKAQQRENRNDWNYVKYTHETYELHKINASKSP